jgi:hypothetical protein
MNSPIGYVVLRTLQRVCMSSNKSMKINVFKWGSMEFKGSILVINRVLPPQDGTIERGF